MFSLPENIFGALADHVTGTPLQLGEPNNVLKGNGTIINLFRSYFCPTVLIIATNSSTTIDRLPKRYQKFNLHLLRCNADFFSKLDGKAMTESAYFWDRRSNFATGFFSDMILRGFRIFSQSYYHFADLNILVVHTFLCNLLKMKHSTCMFSRMTS